MLRVSRPSIKPKRVFSGLIAFSLLCVVIALGFASRRPSQRQLNIHPTDVINIPVESKTATQVSAEPQPQTSAQFDLSGNVIAGGGGSSTSGNFRLDGTVGQASVGTQMSNGQFSQTGGFWQPEAGATPTPTVSPTPTPTPTPTSTTIQFDAATYVVGEGDQRVILTVTRSGDVSAASSVDFVTSDSAASHNCNDFSGLASSRCDYLTSNGTVEFVAGQTSSSFSIEIVDDSYAEGNETFTASLNNASGASVGTLSTATATIVDSDIVTGPNPIVNDVGFFVRQQYLDFLNREPDPSGFAFWKNEITLCGSNAQCIEVKRINVSAAFFLSIEFQQTGYLVERLYKAAYGDAFGTSTLGGPHQISVPIVRFNEFWFDTQQIGQGVIVNQDEWQEQLENNKQDFTAEFVQRSPFTTVFPIAMPAAQFVDTLNTNAGNPLSQTERDQLVNDLSTNAKSRAQVLRAVAEDPNFVTAEFNRAFVLMQYFGYLRRNPNDPQDTDYTGYDFWLTKLNQFNGDFQSAEMVKSFISSIEYKHRFGP